MVSPPPVHLRVDGGRWKWLLGDQKEIAPLSECEGWVHQGLPTEVRVDVSTCGLRWYRFVSYHEETGVSCPCRYYTSDPVFLDYSESLSHKQP